jgi:hypothetical protein
VLVAHGRIVQRGRHSDLLADDDRLYARQYASWLEQTRCPLEVVRSLRRRKRIRLLFPR